MNLADKLLMRLERVREVGPYRWMAACSAHDDRQPSLSIREVDGVLLVYCFAGCSVHDVVSAVGLELSDLFPERRPDVRYPLRQPFVPADAITCLAGELTFIQICAWDMAKGEKLTDRDQKRLEVAANRFRAAVTAVGL